MEVGTAWSGWSGAGLDGQSLPLLIFPCTSPEFSSGAGSPGWSRKKGCKMLVSVTYLSNLLKSRCMTSSS